METGLVTKQAVSLQQQPNRFGRRASDNMTVWLFLAPATVLFLIFVIYPMGRSIYFSFFNWKGFGPAVDFVGMDNYVRILSDTIFHKAIANGLIIVVFSLTIQLPLSMALAVMVGRDLPGRAIFRMIFFMPYVISEVIAAIMWMGLYNPMPERGLFNALLALIPGVKPVAWLGNPNIVMACIFVVLTWKYFGLHMLLYLAGLQNIPIEIEEAARIDGAGRGQLFTNITLPLLAGPIRTSVYMSVVGSLQQFILVWIMTKGGPVNASETMATYMYRFGFIRFWLGYGCAVAIVMFLICLIFSLVYQRMSRQSDYLSG
ncbi:MAG: sugar ABC transporter permease [Thermoflexales bacterium]|nr:sugar ABC transporter permease [Thermoflexales bacterium]